MFQQLISGRCRTKASLSSSTHSVGMVSAPDSAPHRRLHEPELGMGSGPRTLQLALCSPLRKDASGKAAGSWPVAVIVFQSSLAESAVIVVTQEGPPGAGSMRVNEMLQQLTGTSAQTVLDRIAPCQSERLFDLLLAAQQRG